MRNLPWVILTFVVSALLTILVVSSALHSGFGYFGVADARIFGSPLAVSSLIAALSGVVMFVVLVRTPRTMTFTDEVIGELLKVSWPTREETVRASVTVILTTAFIASLMAAYDFVWKNVADYFLFTAS